MPSGGGAGRTAPASPPRWAGRAFCCSGVVLHSLLALIPSSTSTTPPDSNGLSAVPAWCLTSRNPLFLRRRAPRPGARAGLPLFRRGAPLPAIPCSFVAGHHAPGPEPAFRCSGVVLHSPLALIPSSTGTTPSGPNRLSAVPAWCFTLRNPLFLRRRAPRSRGRRDSGPAAARTPLRPGRI